MRRSHPTIVAAVLLLAATCWAPDVVRGEDPPPPSLPVPEDPAQAEARKRAEELSTRVPALYGQGKVAEALPLAREWLLLMELALGMDHLELAGPLNCLAVLLQAQGTYGEARPHLERALAILERVRGKEHLDVATILGNLSMLLREMGAYEEAVRHGQRALAILEQVLGQEHVSVAVALNNLASLHHLQGAYAEARPLFARALAIREQALGPDHPDVATCYANLAALLQAEGRYPEARPHGERALAILERALGKDHPRVAQALNSLALLLKLQGAYAEARPLYERSLAIFERAWGQGHPDVANGLNNLAALLHAQGAYAEARPLYARALALREQVLGKDHPEVARSLNNLALLLQAQGALDEARPLLDRALAICEKTLRQDHPLLVASLSNLAALLHAQGAFAEARTLFERTLALRERTLGSDHPEVAQGLNNLAQVLHAEGAHDEAIRLQERGLLIAEQALGAGHPEVARNLYNLALAYETQGVLPRAERCFERALALTEAHAREQLAGLSAQQRLGLLRSTRIYLDGWLAFVPKVGRSGYAEVLRLRGLVTRAEAAERTLARRADGEQRELYRELLAAQRLAARLAHEIPPPSRAEARKAWQIRYAEVNTTRERLTLQLSKLSAPLRGALERLELGLPDIQARIGADMALVDFLRVKGRYLAWIVRATGDPVRIEVGSAEAIDAACAAFLKEIDAGAPVEAHSAAGATAGAALRALLWAPLQAHLDAGVVRVVLCPDASLAAVPFAALPGKRPATHLLDDLMLSYVSQAQDLVPARDAPTQGQGALLVGGVDYERAGAAPSAPADGAAPPDVRGRASRPGKLLPLPNTRAEVEALQVRLGAQQSTLLLGPEATEARLRDAVKGKHLLHIATHGFVRTDLLAGLHERKPSDAWTSTDTERQLAVGHDPMLLAALAFAGANPREGGGGDDGLLTALEASYLDLDGVGLVTLSACETARGTAEAGEGVAGLVSGFRLAGARAVLASLWKVDDEATRLLMDGVYERLLRAERPLGLADALREAALALRGRKAPDGTQRYAAPRYWAAFVAY